MCRLSPFFFKKARPIDQSEIIEITCLVLHHVSVERVEQPISARRSGNKLKRSEEREGTFQDKERMRSDVPGRKYGQWIMAAVDVVCVAVR